MPSIEFLIDEFEKNKFLEKNKSKNLGVVYTPLEITKYMVSNVFRIYFNDLKDPTQVIESLKILDPACGSGRFLISIADYLYNLHKKFNSNLNGIELKKKIIQNNLYGIDIDERACNISKLRLINWVSPDINIENESLPEFLKNSGLEFNIFNTDFLIDYQSEGFDIIIGNPPYIENKKITKSNYKNNLTKKFKSAYKLFDLSIIFIEKATSILKEHKGCLSFLTPNKFLAADYGIRIRELLLRETQIKEIINISSLKVFQNTSAYPLILFLKKETDKSNLISIKNFGEIKDIKEGISKTIINFPQQHIYNFPSLVIPLSENVSLINKVYTKYKAISEVYKDLRIIYRPYGFINWAKNSQYIKLQQTSPKDLLLLGTGNVGRYFVDFKKQIKVAQRRYQRPYYEFNELSKEIWKDISEEKLIFREIAKDLTFIYDPGVFTNLTGLYFLRIPSFNTDQLFSLLVILNSSLVNKIYKSLYGTLHMSGGYLRINGSFIKKIPIPTKLPNYLSNLGKILQFLTQLRFELYQKLIEKIELRKISNLIDFYEKTADLIVENLYLSENDNPFEIDEIPKIDIKFTIPYYNFPRFISYSHLELFQILQKIEEYFEKFGNRIQ